MNLGIIAEYNPFHNGHLLHLEKSKEITKSKNTIVIMSGNFVQRGEPAVCNKQIRTKSALLNGADMVLELPLLYACSGADVFSYGAIDILNKTGIIDCLCFGSESGNISDFFEASEILYYESKLFKSTLSEQLKTGLSYPAARLKAISILLNKDMSFLGSPNNILALEYIKFLKMTNSKIQPFTIKREKAEFNSYEINGSIASATAIRNAVTNNQIDKLNLCIPENCFSLFLDSILNFVPNLDNYSDILHYIIRTKSLKQLSEISDITEGLENRLLKYSDTFLISDLISKIKTKRYTFTKIQRALLHIILDIKKSDITEIYLNKGCPYIRVLGFKKESSDLVKELSEKSSVPVIINLKNDIKKLDNTAINLIQKEILSTDLYYMYSSRKTGEEYRQPIIVL